MSRLCISSCPVGPYSLHSFANLRDARNENARSENPAHQPVANTSSNSRNAPSSRPVFTVIALLIPVVFFVVLEGVLRLAGYGEDYPLFIPVPGYEDYLYPSPDVARRYFPAANTIPGIPFDSFPASKDSSAFRIFVQGGSTAAGFPYYHGGSFADMLEQRLLQTFPDRSIEVVNTAMAAVNSFTLFDFVDEILDQEPDLVIIYAGHNEYYGALGVGSSISLGPSPAMTRLYLKLDHLRTVQGLRTLLSAIAGLGGRGIDADDVSGTLMEQVVGNQSIAYGSSEYHRGLRQFRSNLGKMLEAYRKAGVPVFVGTVSSNLRDHRPFINGYSSSQDGAAIEALIREASAAAATGDTSLARSTLTRAVDSDSIAAVAYWARARLEDQHGNYGAAVADYAAAKDRDQLRFRAPEAINQIIREEASRAGATVIESYDRMADAAKDGIIGGDLMTEHLHPNISGYFQIAAAMYESLRSEQVIGNWSNYVPDDVARNEVLVTRMDSLTGALRVEQLMGSWPFQPKGTIVPLDVPDEGSTLEETLAYRLFKREVNRHDALDQLRGYYLAQDNYHEALKTTLAVIQRYPFTHQPYLSAASIMVEQRRLPEALAYVDASLDRKETGTALELKGSVLLAMGRNEQAIPVLERAVAINPQAVNALYNLAGGLARLGRRDDAREIVARILTIRPDHAAARQLGRSLGMSV